MQLLYGFARDINGELIKAADAEKGGQYFCGYCKERFVLRKSGKTGPRTKRPHFAHKALTPNCTPESALHFEFKNLLYQRIVDALHEGTDFPLTWECPYCRNLHSGHLLKKAKAAALEYNLGFCRPDIALLDNQGRAIAAIEVVVTHPPEEAVAEYYKLNKIVLVECNVTSDVDLDDVTAKFDGDVRVHLCPGRERCPTCGNFQSPVLLRIFEAKCYKCRSKLKVPFINGQDSRGSHVGSDRFTPGELEVARKHGALIERKYSRTLNTRYWATTCPRCKSFIGRDHLYMDYILPALCDRSPMFDVILRQYCGDCRSYSASILNPRNNLGL